MLDKLKFEETKLAMMDAYKFNYTFDGANGEPALKFRRQMILFDTKARNALGSLYRESKVVSVIRNSMTGVAREGVSEDKQQMMVLLTDLLDWFDNTFNLGDLREDLYNELLHWKIDSEEDNLAIVQRYKNKLRLFNLTYHLASSDTLAVTFLSPKIMVAALIKSIEVTKPKLHEEIVYWTGSEHRTSKDLNELKTVIIQANENIKILRKITNKTPKNPVVQHSVNAIDQNSDLVEFKSNNQLKFTSSFPNSNNNNYNLNDSKFGSNNGQGNRSTNYNNENSDKF